MSCPLAFTQAVSAPQLDDAFAEPGATGCCRRPSRLTCGEATCGGCGWGVKAPGCRGSGCPAQRTPPATTCIQHVYTRQGCLLRISRHELHVHQLSKCATAAATAGQLLLLYLCLKEQSAAFVLDLNRNCASSCIMQPPPHSACTQRARRHLNRQGRPARSESSHTWRGCSAILSDDFHT